MIARLWHGTVPVERLDAYAAFLRERALPDYLAVPGNLGVQLLLRRDGPVGHVVALTRWSSWDAIRAFAGAEPARAKYYPEDAGFLLECEPFVQHYDVAAIATAAEGFVGPPSG